jgi:hypothetical protein
LFYLSCANNVGYFSDLGGNKILRVKDFKGKTYVDIREFYNDKATGEQKPGTKGVMLNMEQWGKIVHSLEGIKAAIPEA